MVTKYYKQFHKSTVGWWEFATSGEYFRKLIDGPYGEFVERELVGVTFERLPLGMSLGDQYLDLKSVRDDQLYENFKDI
jgi:hypothetical protein